MEKDPSGVVELMTVPRAVSVNAARAMSPPEITSRIGKSIVPGKFPIALIVRRHRHDGAGAIAH